MKELILNPVIFSLLLLMGIVYLLISFQLFNRYGRGTRTFEKICVLLLLLSIGGFKLGLFGKFAPSALYLPGKKLYSLALQVGIYSGCLLLVFSRWKIYLKHSTYFISSLSKQNPFFIIHIFWIFICSLLSDTPEYTLKATLICLLTTIFFIYIGKQFTWQELFDLLLWYQLIILFLSVFYCLFVPSVGRPIGSWIGVFTHKNALGPVMSMSAIFLYLQSLRVPNYRWLFLSLVGLSVFTLLQANSGMSKVLLVVLISLLGLIRFIRRLPPRLAFALMGFFLAIGVAFLILITENADYIIVEQLGKDLSLSGRTYFWPLVVNAINKHPIFGYGYQGFWQPWRGIDNPALPIRTPKLGNFIPEHSHNGFLDMGLDIGWLGLAFFLISLLTNIYYGVVHVIRNKEIESSIPLVIFTWLIITNVTETGIATISFVSILYILMTARLTMDNTLETLRINSQHQRHTSWELESISETNRTSFRRSQ